MIFTTLIITRDCLSDPTIGLHVLYEPVHKFGHLLSTIVNLESKKVHATMLHRESMSSPFSTSLSKLQALVLISTNHLDTNHKAQQPCKTIKKSQKPSKILLVYWMRSNSEDIDECHVIDHHQQTLFDNSNTLQKKNPALPSSAQSFSLSTGAAGIIIFVVLRVPNAHYSFLLHVTFVDR